MTITALGNKRGRKSAAELGIHPIDRFWVSVEQRGPNECWPWLGGKSRGYGMFNLGDHQMMGAHQFSYLICVGSIAPGLELDHQCHTAAVLVGECQGGDSCAHRACVNPRHLEPVSRQVNSQRGFRPTSGDECQYGHPREGNTYHSADGRTSYCIPCNREAKRRYLARLKAATA